MLYRSVKYRMKNKTLIILKEFHEVDIGVVNCTHCYIHNVE